MNGIKYIEIRNFKSILDLTIDLRYGEGKAPNGWRDFEVMPFIEGLGQHRYVPILGIYGANASGKTNILEAVKCFCDVIQNGVEGNFKPNRINPKYNSTSFAVAIQGVDSTLVYELEYDRFSLRREKLACQSENGQFTVFSAVDGKLDPGELAGGSYGPERLSEIFKVECMDGHERQYKTFLGCLARNYLGLSWAVAVVADALLKDTAVYLHNAPPLSYAIDKLVDSRASNDVKGAFGKIVKVLRKFDFSLRDIKLEREVVPSSDLPKHAARFKNRKSMMSFLGDSSVAFDQVTTYHAREDGGLEAFDFQTEESEGTKIAAGLVGVCLWALERGAIVFFDELDRSLHPILLLDLVRMFKCKSTNPQGAQLVFTLHDTTLLEDATTRTSEIAVVNNNAHDGTRMTRLSELYKEDGKAVRNVHNFRKQYMEGLLSGVPHPLQ